MSCSRVALRRRATEPAVIKHDQATRRFHRLASQMPRGAGVDLATVVVRAEYSDCLQWGVRRGDGKHDGKHDGKGDSALIAFGGSPC